MLYLMHFSPNGTTLRTLQNIAEGMGEEGTLIDLSLPENRQREYSFTPEDTVLYGTISAGMLFTLNKEIFSLLHGNGAKFAGIALYGNGYYGVALQQLHRRATRQGFRVIAVASFIGQHAQNGASGAGRPDGKDVAMQRKFGEILALKEEPVDFEDIPVGRASAPVFNALVSARTLMLGQDYTLPAVMKKNAVDRDKCIGCGTCARNCPVQAITMQKDGDGSPYPRFHARQCIACYRCINRCPKQAISCVSGIMNTIVRNFGKDFAGTRKEPDIVV